MIIIRFIFSFIFILLFTPLMLLIAAIIFFVDKESPIYFSKRIGKDSKVFMMPKFRTMSSNTPQKSTATLENPDNYLLKTGAFLRKYSLDELPQIYSILRGDMAYVGPRPALFNQYDLINIRKEKGIDKN